MTVLATVLATLLSFLNVTSGNLNGGFVTKDTDLRNRANQEAFNEEDMFSAGQMGHCPHG